MARTSKVDLTYLCRHCGQPLACPRDHVPFHINPALTVLCLATDGSGIRNPATHAEPTRWKMVRWTGL